MRSSTDTINESHRAHGYKAYNEGAKLSDAIQGHVWHVVGAAERATVKADILTGWNDAISDEANLSTQYAPN